MKQERKQNEKEKMRAEKARERERQRNIGWDKLDNTANIFPVIAGEELTNVYRISITLNETIDQELLQKALDVLLKRFPAFNLRLRQGLFWYYFEENGKPAPRVVEESTYPCRYIRDNKNNSYLFRVTYFEERINLEVSHVLTDGMGGFTFAKELACQYLRLGHPELIEALGGDKLSSATSFNRDDGFLKNYRSKKKGTAYGVKMAFRLRGEKLGKGRFGVCHVYLSVKELKEFGKKFESSINDVLVADLIYSIYREQWTQRKSKYPIRINIPVNLRPYFKSETSKNFFVMVSVEFLPEKEDYTYEEVLQLVHADIKKKITRENLEVTLSYNAGMAHNLVAKVVPLVIKNQGMLWAYRFISHSNTATVTNVGAIQIEDEYKPYVKGFHAMLAVSMAQLLKGTVCSYGDKLTFTFSTLYRDTSIERRFVRTLSEAGLTVSAETNGLFY